MTKPFSPRRNAHKHHWTAAEIELLRAHYPTTKTAKLSATMGIPINAIHGCANKHGICKTREYIAIISREHASGVETRFKPGVTPWNKGLRYTAGGRSAETRFKPGITPANRRQVGDIRTNSDGYLDIKVAPGPRQWVQLSRYNWMLHHGSYPPKGMPIAFKDGNPQNCAIENLELITRAELMLRNTCHNHGPEIAQLIQLRGAITRQINKRAKQDKEAA